MRKTNVILNTDFIAVHCWPECPFDDVSFLRHPHRHKFTVTMKFSVSHTDRDIEFIRMKDDVTSFIRAHFDGKDLGRMSCEDIAVMIMNGFEYTGANYVSVFEDGENGAELIEED